MFVLMCLGRLASNWASGNLLTSGRVL